MADDYKIEPLEVKWLHVEDFKQWAKPSPLLLDAVIKHYDSTKSELLPSEETKNEPPTKV